MRVDEEDIVTIVPDIEHIAEIDEFVVSNIGDECINIPVFLALMIDETVHIAYFLTFSYYSVSLLVVKLLVDELIFLFVLKNTMDFMLEEI
jgi:hypothetical protein